jgi:hypothetical protein
MIKSQLLCQLSYAPSKSFSRRLSIACMIILVKVFLVRYVVSCSAIGCRKIPTGAAFRFLSQSVCLHRGHTFGF